MTVSLTFTFPTAMDAAAFLATRPVGASEPAVVVDTQPVLPESVGTVEQAAKAVKEHKAPKPSKVATAAPTVVDEPAAAPAEKVDTPPAKLPTYEESGLAQEIADCIGDKAAADYADRRAAVVALLTKYGAKRGPDLKPEQFAEFGAELAAIASPI
jgi:hypothetical protein